MGNTTTAPKNEPKKLSNTPLFKLGQMHKTPGVAALFASAYPDVPGQMPGMPAHFAMMGLIIRHSGGDWGTVDAHDTRANNAAVEDGTRILSAYEVPTGVGEQTEKVWIITEANRSMTTILLPDEY